MSGLKRRGLLIELLQRIDEVVVVVVGLDLVERAGELALAILQLLEHRFDGTALFGDFADLLAPAGGGGRRPAVPSCRRPRCARAATPAAPRTPPTACERWTAHPRDRWSEDGRPRRRNPFAKRPRAPRPFWHPACRPAPHGRPAPHVSGARTARGSRRSAPAPPGRSGSRRSAGPVIRPGRPQGPGPRRNEKRRLRARRLRPAAAATPRDPTSQIPKIKLRTRPLSTAGHSKRDRPKHGRQGHQSKRGHPYRAKAGPAMLPRIANQVWLRLSRRPFEHGWAEGCEAALSQVVRACFASTSSFAMVFLLHPANGVAGYQGERRTEQIITPLKRPINIIYVIR